LGILPKTGVKRIFTGQLIDLFHSFGGEERELPFAFIAITIMASCGISPYESFKRLMSARVLPFIQMEAREIVRRVEMLGIDPLNAMLQRARETKSKVYSEFLSGYVSTVRGGGNVIDYLESKLRSIINLQITKATHCIEKLETLVESYMVMLLILLCTYILVAVISSTKAFSSSLGLSLQGPNTLNSIVFIIMPLISLLFMFFAHIIQKGTLITLKSIYMKALPATIAVIIFVILAYLIPEVKSFIDFIGIEPFTTLCLSAISIPPMIFYQKMIRLNLEAEDEMPNFLRNVCEARKTGMSPEKSIIHGVKACKTGSFSRILEQINNQIEWGVSLKKVFIVLKEKINSWPVLATFFVLIETIEAGGGPSHALELLTSYSERLRDIEKNKQDMLRPYVILPFIWSGLMALTFSFTFFVITQIPILNASGSMYTSLQQQMEILSSAIIFHCWLSGFFIGKVTKGTFAAGFLYSLLLAVTAFISLVLSGKLIGLISEVLI